MNLKLRIDDTDRLILLDALNMLKEHLEHIRLWTTERSHLASINLRIRKIDQLLERLKGAE